MAISLLGKAAMTPLLAGRGRIIVANRTAVDDHVVIVAAAVVRHRSSGATQSDAVFGLDIEAAESIALEALPPEPETPEAAEVLLRLRVGPERAIVDVYALAGRSSADPNAAFEVGVKRHDGVIGEGENTVEGFAEFAVYGLPAVT
jgi:hypothetical protein